MPSGTAAERNASAIVHHASATAAPAAAGRRRAPALLLFALVTLAGLAAAAAAPAAAQHDHAAAEPEATEVGIRLYTKGLGPYSRAVTTTSPQAQAFFDQAVQLQYAFTPEDAAKSFREAQERDPECAMCHWGEAWALGPYLNGRMSAENATRARAAILRARRLADDYASDVERALIHAMAVRYADQHDPAVRPRLDSAYAAAMADVFAAYPADLDVGTLYAEALMLLEPRRGTWDIAKPAVQRIHQVLEHVLARDITHPGACHLYVHATESTVRPDKAEACADHLGSSIPGASHINHMPSHTYNRVGRWGDAVRANIQAWHSDQRAAIGEGFAIYPSHNLHMLLFAASMDGQGAIAVQAAKDYARLVRGGAFYHALALVRFGRFHDVLELNPPPEPPIYRGLWDFARGYAHLRLGRPDSARAYLDRVESAARTLGDSVRFRGHAAASLLGIVGDILRAERLRVDGRPDDAIAALERATELEDALTYDEPEPLNFSARHWLGATLLEAGRAADAERVYRAALDDHPRNGWSLFGLEQALRALDRHAEADRVRQDFEQAWARADVWLRASRF